MASKQSPSLLRRVWRVVVLLLVVLGGLFVVSIWWIGREISQLESAAWDRAAFEELEARKMFLERVATARLLPDSLESRARGLLGDLAYQDQEFQQALDHYLISLDWLGSSGHLLMAGFKNLVPSAWGGSGDFARGFTDYKTAPPPPPALEDADLVPEAAPGVPGTGWAAFAAIPHLDEDDEAELRDLIQTPEEEPRVAAFCSRHAHRVQSLRQVSEPPVPTDPDDVLTIRLVANWVRLLVLDALTHARAERGNEAARSFGAAFHTLSILEQAPALHSLLTMKSLREEIAGVLESAAGAPLRPHFRPDHWLPGAMWRRGIQGEYQRMKRLFSSSLSGTDPMAARLRSLTLSKVAKFWRKVLNEGGHHDSGTAHALAMSRWFFQSRRFLVHPGTGSYADGFRVAAGHEDCLVEVVGASGAPNLGRLHESIEALRAREVALAIP
jgi:hypothetical protein